METSGSTRAYVSATQVGDVVSGTFSLPANTSAAAYLKTVCDYAAPEVEVPQPVRFAPAACEATAPDAAPFLTVIMRTQGKRLEEIADVLLCLSAQQDDDFELLIMGHRVEEERRAALMEVVASFPARLVEKISYYPVDYGTRTTPLQIGFSVARGRYISVLDDDDLVMDTWVGNFKALAEHNDGKMLHAYVVTQEWSATPAASDDACHVLRSDKTFDPSYCRDFDAASQLSLNSCPLMGLAFPRFAYQELGLSFDETLTTTEDWDFLMRVYSVCGAASCAEVSAIYRLWTNAESSHTLHDAREWDANYTVIVDKMNEHPYLLGAGAVDDVRSKSPAASTSRATLVRTASLLTFDECADLKAVWTDVENLHAGRLSKMKSEHVSAVSGGADWDLAFLFENAAPLSMIAFTPLSSAFEVLGDFKMRLTEVSGAVTEMDFANCAFHNGYQVDCNHIVFLKENPFVAFRLPHAMRLSRVEFGFRLLSSVPDFYIDQVTLGATGLKIGRARRWLGRKINGN